MIVAPCGGEEGGKGGRGLIEGGRHKLNDTRILDPSQEEVPLCISPRLSPRPVLAVFSISTLMSVGALVFGTSGLDLHLALVACWPVGFRHGVAWHWHGQKVDQALDSDMNAGRKETVDPPFPCLAWPS